MGLAGDCFDFLSHSFRFLDLKALMALPADLPRAPCIPAGAARMDSARPVA